MNLRLVIYAGLSAFYAPLVFAHSTADIEMEDNIQVMGSMTYRNDGIVENDQAWLLPGFLMGGHALPAQDGFELDEISISGTKVFENFWLQSQISRHSGHEDVSVDTFFLTIPLEQSFQLELGQMPGLGSPLMQWHASSGVTADMPLLTGVFFGGHTQDQGLRLSKIFESTDTVIGLEAWQGNDWPSTSDENPVSVYLKQSLTFDSISFDAGGWYMNTSAKNRMDERYGSDHHSTVTPINAAYMFTGDVNMGGAYIDATSIFMNHAVSLHGEFITQVHDGVLSDTSESSPLESDIKGYLFELSLDSALTIGYEVLSVENTFGSSVSTAFLNNSGLYNQGFEPERFYASWQGSVYEGLDYRITLIQETLEPDEDNLRFNIGAVWMVNLL